MSPFIYKISVFIFANMLVFAATIPITDAEVQSLDLPTCSDDCMQFYLSEIGCTTDDPDCFCAESQFVSAILQCSAISCTEDDQETMDSDLNDLCEIDSNIPGGLSVTSLPLFTTLPATLPFPAIGPFSSSRPLASRVSASAEAGSSSTSPASASTTINTLPPLSLNGTSTTNTKNSDTTAGRGSTTAPAASTTASSPSSSSAASPLFTSCNTAGVTGLVFMLGTMLELVSVL